MGEAGWPVACRERRPELLQLRSPENWSFKLRSRYEREVQEERRRFIPSKRHNSVGGDRESSRGAQDHWKSGCAHPRPFRSKNLRKKVRFKLLNHNQTKN
ncbi:hypothetical protein COP2_027814 [Malus domestica]